MKKKKFYESDNGQLYLRVLIDFGLVLDVLCPVGVSKGGNGLLVVVVRGGKAGHHQGLGVAPQGVLGQIVMRAFN